MKRAPRFEFISGSLALDFVDTVGNRVAVPHDRFAGPVDLGAWLLAAKLCHGRVVVAPEDLHEARALRAAIYRCTCATIRGVALRRVDVASLNRMAARMPLRPQMRKGALVLVADSIVSGALSLIAGDALNLLTSTPSNKFRICPGCRMLFIDRSRPGKRIWCSSRGGCGNRDKVRRHRGKATPKGRA